MNTMSELLDKMRERCSLASDNALGRRIGVSRQAIYQWRTGSKYPNEDMIAQIARNAGVDPGEWLVRVQVERSSGDTRRGYMSILERIGATMAAIVLFLTPITNAEALSSMARKTSGNQGTLYIMSALRRWSMRDLARSRQVASPT